MTVVMITQYMEEAARCGRVAVMNGGRLVAQGAPREVFGRAEALRAAGLEPPEAVQLREALRQGGMPVDGDPITLEELADAICRSLSNN